MKICWVKILTAVAGGSTDAYVVSPLDSGYKRAHAQSVCTGPFSRVGRGLGTGDEARVPLELTFRPHKVDSQIIVTARMQFGKFCSLFIIYMNLHKSFKPLT